MKKIDAVVARETLYVTAWVLVFSVIMEAVFLLLGKWDFTVLFGNLLGAVGAVINFLLLGITVQNAVSKDEKDAKNLVKLSYTLRNFMYVAICVVGFVFECFNIIAVLVPLLFPSVAVKLRMIWYKDPDMGGENANEKET